MLNLVTGLPGTGKTLKTIQLVEKYRKDFYETELKTDPEATLRDVYYYGIPELTLDWIQMDSVERWFELPVGAIIVVDEAQRHFPMMSAAAKRPEHYSRFDMHRHQGHDIYLLTQDPALVDTNVKAMSASHYHLTRPHGMELANVYHWQSVQTTRGKDFSKDKLAIHQKWPYPKELYNVYKSADAHTHKRNLPWKKLMSILVFFVLAAITFIWAMLQIKGEQPAEEVSQEESNFSIPTSLPSQQSIQQTGTGLYNDLTRWQPQIDNLPMSAPVYAERLTIQDVPRVSGCMMLKFTEHVECSCTDQQGNYMDISVQACVHHVERGSFDPTIRKTNTRNSRG